MKQIKNMKPEFIKSRNKKIHDFNADGVGVKNGNLFGLPFEPEESNVVIIPVPWEVTVSYKSGTAKGPESILKASSQIDYFDPTIKDAWKIGIAMLPINKHLRKENKQYRKLAADYIDSLENQSDDLGSYEAIVDEINFACKELNLFVKNTALEWLNSDKIVGVLGGDHSTPLGLIQALATKQKFSILQFDAHADLREAYEGFTYSHASIMYNAIQIENVENLIQVGIRDYCESEANLIENNPKIKTFFNRDLQRKLFTGKSWSKITDDIIKPLHQNVYISFDIDGLEPFYCPNTGTPVPGGLSFDQAIYVIEKLVANGNKIIGFDLNEVSPGKKGDWDANVGARLLYKLACNAAASQNKNIIEEI